MYIYFYLTPFVLAKFMALNILRCFVKHKITCCRTDVLGTPVYVTAWMTNLISTWISDDSRLVYSKKVPATQLCLCVARI